MSKGKGKGGSPKVYAVIRADGKGCTVIARSAKAARQIAKEHGVTIMQGRAVLETELSPKDATDALNHPSRKSG